MVKQREGYHIWWSNKPHEGQIIFLFFWICVWRLFPAHTVGNMDVHMDSSVFCPWSHFDPPQRLKGNKLWEEILFQMESDATVTKTTECKCDPVLAFVKFVAAIKFDKSF